MPWCQHREKETNLTHVLQKVHSSSVTGIDDIEASLRCSKGLAGPEPAKIQEISKGLAGPEPAKIQEKIGETRTSELTAFSCRGTCAIPAVQYVVECTDTSVQQSKRRCGIRPEPSPHASGEESGADGVGEATFLEQQLLVIKKQEFRHRDQQTPCLTLRKSGP
jgi:hypothetical protein